MTPRSWLFVPADRPERLDKARSCGADAVILDLEDSVAQPNKAAARQGARDFLSAHPFADRPVQLWVRVNPLGTAEALPDLAAVLAGGPDGIVLPKPQGAQDVRMLGAHLAALETVFSLRLGSTRILPIVTEAPASLLAIQGYAGSSERLCGLTWGAEDLAAEVGASTSREAAGGLTPLFQLARSLCLATAAAAEVQAVETVYPEFRDLEGLAAFAGSARRDGFTGMLAIHPAQVPVINAAFTPTTAEIEAARRIVAAFAAHPGAGVLALDGRMIDRPHLKQAWATLARMEIKAHKSALS